MKQHAGRPVVHSLAVVGGVSLLLHAWRLQQKLFGRRLATRLDRGGLRATHAEDFADFLAGLCEVAIQKDTRVSVHTNGENFYPAEMEAIRAAQHVINIEMYEFLKGEVADEFLDVLCERARAGVEVRLVIDALGSFGTARSYFGALERAGGRVAYYHPVNSRDWTHLDARTHRKLIVLDGRLAFVGGAGIADQWAKVTKRGPRWRDTMLSVEGMAASALNATFLRNWVACTGEVLAGRDDFPLARGGGQTKAMVITSSPGGEATKSRILYQTLIEAASRTIDITTPYFVPDRSARGALIRAAKDRGLRVRILTAGPHSDHKATRLLGRSLAMRLIRAGAEVYEYQPAMIHAKLMIVDGIWLVAGSTNFDHRSFELNDEVNVAFFDHELAARIQEDFEDDLASSIRLTTHRIRHESLGGKAIENLSWLLRREQ